MKTITTNLLFALTLAACGTTDTTDDVTDLGDADTTDDGTTDDNTDDEYQSLIDVATEAGGFSTLLAAVDAAGLTATLEAEGHFTLFAPNDDAFALLPDGTVDALLNDIPTLTSILTYHLLPDEYYADDVVSSSLLTTASGIDVRVEVDGDVYINDAKVLMTDIEADNGIIHVIDTVMIPPGTITDLAVATPDLSTLVAALQATDLTGALSGDGPFTVFAPIDAAFDALPDGALSGLLADPEALTSVLLYHVVDGRFAAEDVIELSAVTTLEGSEATVLVDDTGVSVSGAQVIYADIPASNGTIHLIDSVMLP